MERYAAITADEFEMLLTNNKQQAIRQARKWKREGRIPRVLDYRHPDLRGIEYARIVWR